MPYKIVQTIENGKIKLSAIPEQWEDGGVLRYPKKKYEKLRQNENFLPKESWPTINCIVKRANLCFREAEAEIDQMCKTSDTELERATDTDIEDNGHQTKRRKQENHNNIADTDFIQIANECLNNDVIYSAAVNEQNEVLYLTQDAGSVQFSIPEIPVNNSSNLESKLDNLIVKVNLMSENITIVQRNQQELYKTQQDLLFSLAHINTQFEELIKKVHVQPQVNECDVGFKRISDQASFDNFEKMLEDVNFTQNMIKKMSAVCGTHRGKGINNAYALVDVIFERQFLQQCSWAGGSRTDSSKICFKSRTNTLNFFFTVINKADENFTLTDTQKFFKVILRNSRQRVESQQERTSVTKSRGRKRKPAPCGLVGLPEVANIELSIQESREKVQSIVQPGLLGAKPLIQESRGDVLSVIVNQLSIKPPAQVEAIVQPGPSDAESLIHGVDQKQPVEKRVVAQPVESPIHIKPPAQVEAIVQPGPSDAESLIHGEDQKQPVEKRVVAQPVKSPIPIKPPAQVEAIVQPGPSDAESLFHGADQKQPVEKRVVAQPVELPILASQE